MSETKNFPPITRTPSPQGPGPGPGPSNRDSDSYAATDRPDVDAQRPLSAASAAMRSAQSQMPAAHRPPGTKARAVWSGVIVTAIVLILLLIFIVQNTGNVPIHFFGFSGQLPIAVALLFAAIAGVLLLAIPGTIRMLQLRKAVRAERTTHATPPGAMADPSATNGV